MPISPTAGTTTTSRAALRRCLLARPGSPPPPPLKARLLYEYVHTYGAQ